MFGGSRIMGTLRVSRAGLRRSAKTAGSIVVSLGRPRALLVATQQASYKPITQKPYDKGMRGAVARIPRLWRPSSKTPSSIALQTGACAGSGPRPAPL
ncbi:hypothetical protein SAMN05192568_103085 [Methylobacterium pseudosasicola]|uniref:Uncharacterized protein n=1 Tax=Methylobacterium pseudosasicola TaxID=582667 RepID=A0A1I4QNL5_9HYPH|nr:hypothetical protein SAMN05192568_103085 [Methylobacterium pseudosasicola]